MFHGGACVCLTVITMFRRIVFYVFHFHDILSHLQYYFHYAGLSLTTCGLFLLRERNFFQKMPQYSDNIDLNMVLFTCPTVYA